MKANNKAIIRMRVFVMMVLMMVTISAFAQQGGQDIDGFNALEGTNDAPIDGGLSFLLAAGAAYGVKKYKDQQKRAK